MELLKEICDLNDFPYQSEKLKKKITKKWDELQNTSGVFKYKLNIREDKILPGQWKFYCQLNPDRAHLRRIPQHIASLNPQFDENKFNFNKTNPNETMTKIKWKDSLIFTFLVNQSPLTPYHSLICPRMEDNIPQILNEESIDFCLNFLSRLDDRNFRIGYNSPGALASVNHLHLHLLYLDQELFIDNVELLPVKEQFYKTIQECPVQAFCWIFKEWNNSSDSNSIQIKLLYQIVKFLCRENIPHNLFFTFDRNCESIGIKVFIFIRQTPCVVKDVLALNLGFCELSGYFPVGDEDLYHKLTEDHVVNKIKTEIGNIFEAVETKICNL